MVLPRTTDRVAHVDVDLGPVERAAALVDRVLQAVPLERLPQTGRGHLPQRVVADELVDRLRRQLGLELVEPERAQHRQHEVEQGGDLVGRLLAHDVELPAGELARETDVLSAATDRLRKLLLRDGDVHAVGFLIDDDRAHLGGRHGVYDELRRILVPGDDVDALARDLARDRLHARATHADAGPDRVDARVVAAHRDLGAGARVTRRAQYVDQALTHFGDFELEELDQELRRGTRQEELRAARL